MPKMKITLSKEEAEKIYDEAVKEDKRFDIFAGIVTAVLGVIAIAEYVMGGDYIPYAEIFGVGVLFTGISVFLSLKRERALRELKEKAEKKGEVVVEANVDFVNFKVVE